MRHFIVLSVLVLTLTPIASPETYVVTPTTLGGIQGVIDIATDGDIIELTDGIFAGDGNRDIRYYGKAITVRSQSGNAEACVIDCEGTASHPHRGFIFEHGEGSDSALQGVTIRNGYLNQPDSGAGVSCDEGCSPSLVNCIFWGNSARCGGAIVCRSASPSVSSCLFFENTANYGGAIISCWDSSPSLTNCSFVSNTTVSEGGAIYT